MRRRTHSRQGGPVEEEWGRGQSIGRVPSLQPGKVTIGMTNPPEEVHADETPSEKGPLWKRLLPVVLGLVLVVVLFGWVLPQFID